MKFLRRLLVALVIVVVLILVAAAFFPAKVHIEDSTTVNVPAKVVFTSVNSLKTWEQWSPFQKADPEMTSEYSGPASGVGCMQTWKSKKNGNGSLSIVESVPGESIKMKLKMMDNKESMSNWQFDPEGTGTKVTWSIDIEKISYPFERIIALFMPGKMHDYFRSGLADLKNLCEKQYAEMMKFKTGEISVIQEKAWSALAVKDSASLDKISDVMNTDLDKVQKYMKEKNIECIGAPYAYYYLWDEKANKFIREVGFPVKGKQKGSENIKYVNYPATKAVTASHFGAYETLSNTYGALTKYVESHNMKQKKYTWEVYITDPATQPDMSKWETKIYYPVEK